MMGIERAIVLSAGYGTRMRPLTHERPKPLVELHGRTLIDRALDRLVAIGIKEVVVNLHYLGDMLENHLRKRMALGEPPTILFSDERDTVLDTGGGTKKALPLLGEKPFITFNSDSAWMEEMGSTLEQLIRFFDPERMDAALLIADSVRTLGSVGRGDFDMDTSGRLRRRDKRAVAAFIYAGVQIIKPEVVAEGPDGAFSMNLIWDRLIEEDRLFGWRMRGTWMHVGTPHDLDAANHFIEGRLKLPDRGRER